ncbi:MAG: hypothetical protein IPO13_02585 [Rhodocyclaceae bacterium]|nr:hypothetical protein [Rhodocyclaceae bacterium]
MKKILLVYLLIASNLAFADWIKLSDNDDATVYIDLTTLRKDGNLRTVWQLHDEMKASNDGTLSSRILWEYDCNGERVRMLSASGYSGPKATGKKLYTFYKTTEWRDIAPETMGQNGLKAVCTK